MSTNLDRICLLLTDIKIVGSYAGARDSGAIVDPSPKTVYNCATGGEIVDRFIKTVYYCATSDLDENRGGAIVDRFYKTVYNMPPVA